MQHFRNIDSADKCNSIEGQKDRPMCTTYMHLHFYARSLHSADGILLVEGFLLFIGESI